uniref:Endoglucanase H n=1 Tax=Meiothermus taiwanensis WR-220 TaxID=1339250 RepID=UPI002176F0F3|nr:Chain A, Endoglucanase H [Meiothermus taiwanensis WR-220]7VT4_B Chain B, Endoglucanase H [Meiothermus taiwanensis WR-220]
MGCQSTQLQTPAPDTGGIVELNRQLGRGVNLGNALEAPWEGAWGVRLEEGFFELIREAGFKTIRLPVSWTHHAGRAAPYTIDPAFFSRVDWAVTQATRRGLNIVVNVHHYDELNANPQAEEARYLSIWRQIAERYRNQPGSVYFELLNEPHGRFNDNPQLWNDLLAKALRVVRESNPSRAVIVGPVGWNSLWRLSELRLPDDPNLIVTFHYYDPLEFTHQGAEWLNPVPPTGVVWRENQGAFAAGWQNWSWGSRVGFVGEALEITYQEGWAGFYLHSDAGVEGYDRLAFRTSAPVSLQVSCRRDAPAKAVTTSGGVETVVNLSECGNPSRLTDLILQNNSPNARAAFRLERLELRGPGSPLALLTHQQNAIAQAMEFAQRWAEQNRRPIFVGQFGAYEKGDLDSRVRWTGAVRSELEKRNFSWAYWEFAAGFGIYDRTTRQWRTPLLKALVPEQPKLAAALEHHHHHH